MIFFLIFFFFFEFCFFYLDNKNKNKIIFLVCDKMAKPMLNFHNKNRLLRTVVLLGCYEPDWLKNIDKIKKKKILVVFFFQIKN